jgi:hypothetical protein
MAASDELNRLNKEIAELRKQLGKNYDKPFLSNEIEKARESLRGLKADFAVLNNDLRFISDSFKNSVAELTKQNYFLNLSKSSLKGIVGIADKFLDVQRGTSELSKKEIQNLKNRGELLFRNLVFARDYGDLKEAELANVNQAIAAQEEFNKGLQDAIDFQNQINDNFGVKIYGSLNDITKAIPGLGKLAPGFQAAAEAAKQTAIDNQISKDLVSKAAQEKRELDLEALKTGKGLNEDTIKRLGLEGKLLDKNGKLLTGAFAAARAKKLNLAASVKPIEASAKGASTLLAGFKALLPIFKQILGPLNIALALLEANKEVVELQKSMALTSIEATDFRQNLSTAAALTGDINVTTTRLLQTFSALNKQFGFITNFSAQTLATTTQLTKVVGISAEAAGMLAAGSEATGQNFEENYKNILASSYELQRQSGVQFDLRRILEDTGKITGQIRANFAGNVVEISKAVTQAKLLGTDLQTVSGIANSLLDFESSITSELAAQVITGRQLEFSRARLLANEGDLLELGKELQKQLGSFTEFSKMTRIEQGALAEAFGLSTDALSDLLFQQEIQGRNARELRALGREDLAQRLEAQTAAQKFNATLEKLQSLLTDAVTAFAPLLDALGYVFNIVGKIVEFLQPVLGTVTGALTGAAIGGVPGAIVGGILGAVSDIDRANTSVNTPTSPRMNSYRPAMATVNNNNDALLRQTQTTNALLGQLVNKTGTIKIDSTNIGTGLSVNSRQIQ